MFESMTINNPLNINTVLNEEKSEGVHEGGLVLGFALGPKIIKWEWEG